MMHPKQEVPEVAFSRVRVRWLALALALLTSPVAAGAQGPTAGPPVESPEQSIEGARYVPGEVIVQYRGGAPKAQRARALERAGGVTIRRLRPAAEGRGGLELARVASGRPAPEAARLLQSDPAVEYAEPNWIYMEDAASNDPRYTDGTLWGLCGDASSPANAYGSQAAEVWAGGNVGSTSVHLGLMDRGIDFYHPDIGANVWTNPYDPADGRDNDGNGYVDDIHGWDFANDDNSIYDGMDSSDTCTESHGTHVAGTMGAVGGNGRGVVGVNWRVNIISAKFMGDTQGTTANAVRALDYLIDLKRRHGLNIPAVNNSWGGVSYSQALSDAIGRARAVGMLFVASAGNSSDDNDSTQRYPSSYPHDNVVAVSATNRSGGLADFSNYGEMSVDIGAPGDGVYSTLPRNTYGSMSGTSMAAPHVTGGIGLYAAGNPGASMAQIKSAILSTVVPTSGLAGKVSTGGRMNLSKALTIKRSTVGGINGRVTDAAGRPVAGATVRVLGTALTATTSSTGSYQIIWVPLGTWQVSAQAGGYSWQTKTTSVRANIFSPVSYALAAGPAPLNTRITDGPDGKRGSSSATFTFVANRSGVSFECSRDYGSWTACSSPKTYTGLSTGSHSFRVRAKDSAGNVDPTSSKLSWSVDFTRPTVTTISPGSGATGVSVSANPWAKFGESMDSGSINANTMILTRSGSTTPIAATVRYEFLCRRALLNPVSNLAPGTTYTVRIRAGSTGVDDGAGNSLSSDKVWSFTTAR
jgi:hypothetical protein